MVYLESFLKSIFEFFYSLSGSYGIAIIFLSIMSNPKEKNKNFI
jgi:hypothetical protein